jgi:hypothetical protein
MIKGTGKEVFSMNNNHISIELEKDIKDIVEQNAEKYSGKKRRSKRKSYRKFLLTALLVVLWGALVYGGYWYIDSRLNLMHQEINETMADIQKNNHLAIEEINEKLAGMQEDMKDISFSLEQTGKEVSSSGNSAREELNKRIIELDNRLEELTRSLEILKESKGEIR